MKILAIADAVSPIIYSSNFPNNLPPFDLVLSAGDMPGHFLEFIATKAHDPTRLCVGKSRKRLSYTIAETDQPQLPGGCINAHGKVIEHNGVLIAGIEGSARYRPGPHQYSERQMGMIVRKMTPNLWWNKKRKGRAVDILLTHAAPKGPHEGEDFPHRGVKAFNRFVETWKPKLHIHGHVHLNGANAQREYVTSSGVRVINAFEFTLIDLDL